MDKQDFQEQDFMEILVRLPCLRGEKCLSSRREYFTIAMRKYYPREENFHCAVITGEIAL